MKQLKEIRRALEELAEREATKLWRLAREAQKRGCSQKLIDDLREEGWECHTNLQHNPDAMMDWKFEYKMKYAFKVWGN